MAHDVASVAPPAHGALSRRRMLTGAAWATPVVLVGLAAPAAASSPPDPAPPTPLADGVGVDFNYAGAQYSTSHWDGSGQRAAIVTGFGLQNKGNDAPQALSVTVMISVPLSSGGAITGWGEGGRQGLPAGSPWSVMNGSPSVVNGRATLSLVWTGVLNPYDSLGLSNVWIGTGGTPVGNDVTVTATASYASGQTSTRSRYPSI